MSGFGRDEMNAMIGRPQGSEGVEETAGLRQSKPKHQSSSRRTANDEVDISKLTASETAALLTKKGNMGSSNQNTTSVVNNTSRYRTKNKKVLDHHQLLAELSQQQQTAVAIGKDNRKDNDDDDSNNNNGSDSDDEFVRQRRPAQAPVVISRAGRNDDKEHRRRRRSYDSSSSEESSNSGGKRTKTGTSRRRRQRDGGRGGSSSSSSSDEEDDRRRQNRVLASKRVQKEPEIIVPKLNLERNQEENRNSQPEESVHVSEQKQDQLQMERTLSENAIKVKTKSRNTSSSGDDDDGNGSSSSESSSESESSSSSSSSSEEEVHVGLKPVFVPKHKRNVIQTEEKKGEEEETQLQREKELNQKRKMESRALVAKQSVAIESSFTGEDDVDEESRGATNAPPNDDDVIDGDKEKDAWELREIERLLESMDQQLKLKKEEEEYNRRKKLTDAECLREDTESGRYQAPGAARKSSTDQKPTESNHLQKFFHRGAFYMDESEWGEGDIREKAGEYAKAATGEDKINKAKLPEVMQVKNFGLAKQNTKYKGLANEDTTDKSAHILPLPSKGSKKH
jgi:microfibrillar-associated protein 1